MLFSSNHLPSGHTGLFIAEDPWLQLPADQKAEGESSQADRALSACLDERKRQASSSATLTGLSTSGRNLPCLTPFAASAGLVCRIWPQTVLSAGVLRFRTRGLR